MIYKKGKLDLDFDYSGGIRPFQSVALLVWPSRRTEICGIQMFIRRLAVITALMACLCWFGSARELVQTPILVYHRFGPAAIDSMTVSTRVFESQLAAIHEGGYHVIPLRELVDSILSGGSLPPHSIVITADDGHESIYTEMVPRLKRYGYPATLFIYPSAISNAKWAMTWPQLIELEKTGAFDIESHSYWHPNFKIEKRRLTESAYKDFVDSQLRHSRSVLEQKLGKHVDLLAWPFGIYDDGLTAQATHASYRAAFTLERRPVKASDNPMAFPRYLMTDTQHGAVFEKLLVDATGGVGR
jgi:peptidoglycan/xylan/chitin deacetylase (PgdA/CDA1 family)